MSNRKVILYIAMSLDGFIATEEHKLDWLFAVDGVGDNGFSKFYNTIDTILIGNTTYEWIMEQEKGNFPYKDKECYVFSRSVKDNTEYVSFINCDINNLINGLKSHDSKDIWVVGGGELFHTLLGEKLIDEIIVTIAPVLIGKGIPLFIESDFQTHLSLKKINQYNQFVELYYDVKVYL